MDAHLRTLNRLAKWRAVFASKWLGTRAKSDAEVQSVRDLVERTLLLRAEVSALISLLVDTGVFDVDDFREQLDLEAEHLMKELERHFPGFRATDDGIDITTDVAKHTMQGWSP